MEINIFNNLNHYISMHRVNVNNNQQHLHYIVRQQLKIVLLVTELNIV